jgi:ethanolamine utilization protein EutA
VIDDREVSAENDDLDEFARAGVAWGNDNVVLTTVGVDIGSSTSHLMFSKLWLQREAQLLSSRFVVVERRVLYKSPISLTPYRPDGLIDVARLADFVGHAYATAGFDRQDIDTGAVILTGVALERANSRAIAELFAREGGKFVCASAGHILEAILSAHGSGAVELSRRNGNAVLNIDVGGGTTKLTLVVSGKIAGTLAIAVGARLLVFDGAGRIEHLEPSGSVCTRLAGMDVQVGDIVSTDGRRRLGDFMAGLILAASQGQWAELDHQALHLAGSLPVGSVPDAITFSGGVAEFVYGRSSMDYGDLAHELAEAILVRFGVQSIPIVTPNEGIRATVIGASQYSVQLSGSTVFVSDEELLPLRNVPVVRLLEDSPIELNPTSIVEAIVGAAVEMGLNDFAGPVAVAIPWNVTPRHTVIRSLAEALLAFHRSRDHAGLPLIVAIRGDIAATLGSILAEDLAAECGLVILDGLDLEPLDYVDLGEVREPSNVVPVIIKSLVFPGSGTPTGPVSQSEATPF